MPMTRLPGLTCCAVPGEACIRKHGQQQRSDLVLDRRLSASHARGAAGVLGQGCL